MRSGFPSYCTSCYEILKPKRANEETVSRQSRTKAREGKKDTVIWEEEVFQYIQLRALLEKRSKNDFLNNLLKQEIKANPVRIVRN